MLGIKGYPRVTPKIPRISDCPIDLNQRTDEMLSKLERRCGCSLSTRESTATPEKRQNAKWSYRRILVMA